MRDPIANPQSGDKIQHIDGGTIYIYERQGKLVWISRKPWGSAERRIRVSTLAKIAVRREGL